MKSVYLSLCFALIALGLVACGNPKERSYAPKSLCCGASADDVVFKSSTGREVISIHQITSVDVKLNAQAGSTQAGLERQFQDEKARQVIRQLRFAWPQQNGVPASTETGTMLIHYTRADGSDHTRTISIQNNRLLEDKDYPDVVYDPGFNLDSAWLQSQP